ncbi:uncharacterized protein YukE [Saccharothrix ecbatanensis]|uniref:Uncharacterized protein YukE n=1 Tax=Saccharothrix ecbatanensis TaxID=1105145 RepID=A0A7W9M4G4_9PSEU|nr:hypothetical protein [Saccharothrix ecbatanensis]MBB5807087.1 uncharacterized protein YukE [Saccharothrix ecbatanensis]
MTHPAVHDAIKGCAPLAEAASMVGSPNPIDAIRQIDYDPAAIEAYVGQLRAAVKDLAQAIEEQAKAIADHESGTGGTASDSASAEMHKELDELRVEQKGLETLIDEIERIGKRMDEVVRAAVGEILDICSRATPAVAIVLEAGWLPGDAAEEVVHTAVADIIKVCAKSQDEVTKLRADLDKMAASESEGGAASGGVGGPGGGEAEAGGGGAEAGGPNTAGPSEAEDAPDNGSRDEPQSGGGA